MINTPWRAAIIAFAVGAFGLSAAASDWTVDYAESQLTITGTAFKIEREATFEDWKADVSFDPDNPADSRFDLLFYTESFSTPIDDMTSSAKSETWFHVSEHPEARFTADTVKKLDGAYEAMGTLTIKGISREVPVRFTLEQENGKAVARGGVIIDRTDFNVGTGQWADGDKVAKEAKVRFQIVAYPNIESE